MYVFYDNMRLNYNTLTFLRSISSGTGEAFLFRVSGSAAPVAILYNNGSGQWSRSLLGRAERLTVV